MAKASSLIRRVAQRGGEAYTQQRHGTTEALGVPPGPIRPALHAH